jgi:hypothetical protein
MEQLATGAEAKKSYAEPISSSGGIYLRYYISVNASAAVGLSGQIGGCAAVSAHAARFQFSRFGI